jgi:soluble lytic murein transglycosylase-like protein
LQNFIFAVVISTSLFFSPSGILSSESPIVTKAEILNEKERVVIAGSRLDIAQKMKEYNPKLTQQQINMIIKSVNRYSRKYGVPEDLIFAIIAAESQYNPKCTGDLDDTGLMQIREKYAYGWTKGMGIEYKGVETLYDIDKNIHIGVYILNFLFKKYNNRLDRVLIAYNWGHGYVDRALEEGKELPREYINLIKKHYFNIYRKKLDVP